MKKVLFAIVCLFALSVQQVLADKPVSANQLPAKAQQFLKKYFPGVEVSYAKQDADIFDRDYTVVLTNGNRVEFYRNGEWKEVDCEHHQVPAGILPENISKYISDNHKGQQVVEVKKERRHYEVKLQNDLDMEFSLDGKLLKYD